jgi:hypothetical protein
MTQFISSSVVNEELKNVSHLLTDDTILEYIFGMTDEWCEAGSSNEDLVEMILPFLESYIGHDESVSLCENICARLRETGLAKEAVVPNQSAPKKIIPQQKFTSSAMDQTTNQLDKTSITAAQPSPPHAKDEEAVERSNSDNDAEEDDGGEANEENGLGAAEEEEEPQVMMEESGDIDTEQLAALEDLDDFGSAWAECRASGRKWGGRGFGKRSDLCLFSL